MNSLLSPGTGVPAILATLMLHWTTAVDVAAIEEVAVAADIAVHETAVDQPEYLLRYGFHSGQILRYHTTQSATMQSMVGERKKCDVSQVEQTRRYCVESLNSDGSAAVSMQFEHVRMQVRSNDGDPQVFDSRMSPKEIPKSFRSTARQLNQAAPRFTVEAIGVPLNHETLADRQEEAVDDDATPATAGFAIPLPLKPVKVGDTWKTYAVASLRIGPGLKRKVNLLQTFKLEQVHDGIASITFSTSTVGRIASPLEKAQLIQATPQGSAQFHIADGRLLRRELTHDSTVFNAMGPNTMVTSVGRSIETLIPDAEPTSNENTVSKR